MRKLTADEWEKKYVVGRVERFDQKNSASKRIFWDPVLMDQISDLSPREGYSDKTGYALEEVALRWSSRTGARIDTFNTSRPNASPVSKAVAAAIQSSLPNVPHQPYDPPKGKQKVDTTNQERLTRIIKKAAVFFGADLVGICALDRRWVFSHTYQVLGRGGEGTTESIVAEHKPLEIPDDIRYAIVMAFQVDYDLLKYIPTHIADAATTFAVGQSAITSACLASFIEYLGFKAIDTSIDEVVLSIPLAMQAGLGEQGRLGSLITPQFGPRVRLASILTDLPLSTDAPIEFGVDQFCHTCKKCAKMCPSQSITFGERSPRTLSISGASGTCKWQANAETCRLRSMHRNKVCTICIASCPYNKPNTWPHHAVQRCADRLRWADPLYVWMDDLLGYGRPQETTGFWETWKPRKVSIHS